MPLDRLAVVMPSVVGGGEDGGLPVEDGVLVRLPHPAITKAAKIRKEYFDLSKTVAPSDSRKPSGGDS